MDSSFFRIFISNFKFDRPISSKLVKSVPTGFSGFRKNRLIFDRNFNPCSEDESYVVSDTLCVTDRC
jgi:hypothetical protein